MACSLGTSGRVSLRLSLRLRWLSRYERPCLVTARLVLTLTLTLTQRYERLLLMTARLVLVDGERQRRQLVSTAGATSDGTLRTLQLPTARIGARAADGASTKPGPDPNPDPNPHTGPNPHPNPHPHPHPGVWTRILVELLALDDGDA